MLMHTTASDDDHNMDGHDDNDLTELPKRRKRRRKTAKSTHHCYHIQVIYICAELVNMQTTEQGSKAQAKQLDGRLKRRRLHNKQTPVEAKLRRFGDTVYDRFSDDEAEANEDYSIVKMRERLRASYPQRRPLPNVTSPTCAFDTFTNYLLWFRRKIYGH
jgi:hypothetical protein